LHKDIEREDVPFICKTLNAIPAPHIDQFTKDKLGTDGLVEEASAGSDKKIIKVTGCPAQNKTVSILVRGSKQLVLEEAERSLHDALCVVRALVKKRFLVPGGVFVPQLKWKSLKNFKLIPEISSVSIHTA
jgi:T-complex protein 1 subunit delta